MRGCHHGEAVSTSTGVSAAFDELTREGEPGLATLTLLRGLAAHAARGFRPRCGYDRWGQPALDELLSDMLERSNFIIACLAKADDQPSLERLLLRAIRNYLIDEAKATERGKLRRRLVGLLDEDVRFERVPASTAGFDCWTLNGGPSSLWQGDIGELEEAAWNVRGVAVTRWNTAGPTPAGTKHALLTVAAAVLGQAGGCLRDQDLARVIHQRFLLIIPDDPEKLYAQVEDVADEADPVEDDPPWVLEEATDRAEELFASLTPTERAAVPLLGRANVDIAGELAVGRRRAKAISDSLTEKVRIATVDDEDRDAVLVILLRLCEEEH